MDRSGYRGERRGMLKALMTVSGLTLVSRILGFIRDMVVSSKLGATGLQADAWITALQFPNLFRRVLGEGAFNAAFVPLYSRKMVEGSEADRFASRVLVLMSLLLAAICVLAFIFMKPIMWMISTGFDPEKLALTVRLSRITVGYLFFICLVAALSGVLNSRKIFGAPAVSYAMLNVVFLAGLLGVTPFTRNPEYVLAWSTLTAGFVQLAIVVVSCLRNGVEFHWLAPKLDSDVKKLGFLMGPGLVSAGVQQLNLLVGQWVASFQDGGKAFIYYADRIHQLPLGLIGIAFGVVLLPELTRLIRENELRQARGSLAQGLELAVFLAIPAMVGMAVIAEPILFGLFTSGEFTQEDARMAAWALVAFSLGVPAYVSSRILQPGYFAREDTKTPMRFTFVSAAVNIVLCGVVWVTMRGSGMLHVGCAAATSVAGWVNFFLLWIGLKRDGLLRIPRRTYIKIAKMIAAAILMGLAVWGAEKFMDRDIREVGRIARLIIVGLVGFFGVTAYFLVAHLTGAMRFDELQERFRRGNSGK